MTSSARRRRWTPPCSGCARGASDDQIAQFKREAEMTGTPGQVDAFEKTVVADPPANPE